MGKVTFALVAEEGHFVCHDSDGRPIRIEAGKSFSTDDAVLIRELDAQSHAVKRVREKRED